MVVGNALNVTASGPEVVTVTGADVAVVAGDAESVAVTVKDRLGDGAELTVNEAVFPVTFKV